MSVAQRESIRLFVTQDPLPYVKVDARWDEQIRNREAVLFAVLLFISKDERLTLVAFVTVYAVIVAFNLPGALFASLTGGFLFSLFPGTLVNMVAATTGATAIFLAVRLGFGASIAERLDANQGFMGKLKKGIDGPIGHTETAISFTQFFRSNIQVVNFFTQSPSNFISHIIIR